MTREERKRLARELDEIGAGPDEYDCGACGADWGPSEDYIWHWPSEDCRAAREPRGERG